MNPRRLPLSPLPSSPLPAAAALLLLVPALSLGACLTNVPDPNQGGIYACEIDDDCPGTQSCLQGTCEAIPLPALKILNPEDEKPYAFGGGMAPHDEVLTVNASNFVLRPLSESNEAVPGEGHLVVFVDGEEVDLIDSGDLSGGVQMQITIPDVPGVHRIHVQARLNDGTNYDNPEARARNLVWVDDGNIHVALRSPWPGEAFTLDAQGINARVATLGPIEIDAPMTGKQHVHVYYEGMFPFEMCLADALCEAGYAGVVPSNDDEFGPVFLPEAGAGPARLTAVIANSNHTTYYVDDAEQVPVFSTIEILRSNNQ